MREIAIEDFFFLFLNGRLVMCLDAGRDGEIILCLCARVCVFWVFVCVFGSSRFVPGCLWKLGECS